MEYIPPRSAMDPKKDKEPRSFRDTLCCKVMTTAIILVIIAIATFIGIVIGE